LECEKETGIISSSAADAGAASSLAVNFFLLVKLWEGGWHYLLLCFRHWCSLSFSSEAIPVGWSVIRRLVLSPLLQMLHIHAKSVVLVTPIYPG